jgi:hypothetical protein
VLGRRDRCAVVIFEDGSDERLGIGTVLDLCTEVLGVRACSIGAGVDA